MLIFYLALVVVMIPLGTGIAFVLRGQQTYFGHIFGLTAGAVLGVVLIMMMHLYTEVGYLTILVMWGGFFLISIVERLTTHQVGDTNTKNKGWGINLTLLGLSLHSLADGFNLVIATREEVLGGALAFGTIIHRLPVGTFVSVILLRGHTLANTLIRLIPLMFGPVIGVVLGEQLLRGPFLEVTDYLTAFAVGTLLHVVMDGVRGNYVAENTCLTRFAKVLFVVGFVVAFCALYFSESGHHH